MRLTARDGGNAVRLSGTISADRTKNAPRAAEYAPSTRTIVVLMRLRQSPD
ncbi:MAG: hypothetical protein HFP77_04975 [Methylococcales symbiont of Iophon sp. n. MRB-2018]|nr:MAG: hypothetical protein HFP77_04975 [Methylococcales symbiont of Iophon sp. n. MRB-2018]KAF3979964.1 MAG: hypothetical protein HFP76_04505 [Methylococcales symbiont of Iophon sp. n. MRB-2018]